MRRARSAGGLAASGRAPSTVATRAIDVLLGGGALLVASPLLLVVGALVRSTSRGPALFRQERVGIHGRRFQMLKVRTMTASDDDTVHREAIRREISGEAVPDEEGSFKTAEDARVTRIGHWLRRTSLDELPQLINVLRGDMSLVGPRPALAWETELFPPEYRCRADVRPGITGLWQVSGRARLSTLDMLRLDVDYVRSRSLRLYLSILVRTVPVVLRPDGTR